MWSAAVLVCVILNFVLQAIPSARFLIRRLRYAEREGTKILISLIVGAYITVPILVVHGWIRWQQKQSQAPGSKLSLVGFSLGSASAALAIGSAIYAFARGGFAYYDPLLVRILVVGLGVSGIGLMSSLGGIAQKGAVRWHAPSVTALMLFIWLILIAGE